MFQTLQSRLPIELRLAGITDIDAANEFLDSYINEFNAIFALPLYGIKSVFEMQPDDEKINLTLAVITERQVDSGHCISYFSKHEKKKPKKPYVPSMNHPLKRKSFWDYVRYQQHHLFDDIPA